MGYTFNRYGRRNYDQQRQRALLIFLGALLLLVVVHLRIENYSAKVLARRIETRISSGSDHDDNTHTHHYYSHSSIAHVLTVEDEWGIANDVDVDADTYAHATIGQSVELWRWTIWRWWERERSLPVRRPHPAPPQAEAP